MERNIHDGAREEHARDGVQAFHSCAGGILFFVMRVVITEKAGKQTTVIFDGWINRTWETIRVKTIAVRPVVLLVVWVINKESIGCWDLPTTIPSIV